MLMHPNAHITNDQNADVQDPSLNWGSDQVSMSFKNAEGVKVSLPHGTREDYELVGWFFDSGYQSPVPDNIQLSANSTTAYNQTEDTELDKWGDSTNPGYNKDAAENRFWVVGKLEIYAQWRKILDGAEGIGLVYVGNGLDDEGAAVSGTAGSDAKLYKDSARATSITGATPSDASTYRF